LLATALYVSTGPEQPWPPGVSTGIAWIVFAIHVALVLRRLNPVDPAMWIPFAMVQFYFAMPIAVWISGRPNLSSYDLWNLGLPYHLTQGFVAGLVTLAAFIGGMHFAGLTSASGPARDREEAAASRHRSIALASFIVGGGGVAILALGVAIVGPGLVFGAYSDVWYAKATGLDIRLIQAGQMFAAGGAFGLLASHVPGQRAPTILGMIIAAFILMFTMLTGDRGFMMSFGIAAAWVFSRCVRRIAWPAIAVAALLGFLMLPLVKEYRESRSIDEAGTGGGREIAKNVFAELGQTHLIFGYTLDLIPEEKGYDYGMSFVYSILNAIPNPGLSRGKRFLPDPEKHAPGSWLSSTLNPAKYETGGGYGFAMGAEWYFNFGLPGLLLGPGLLGFLLVKVRNSAHNAPIYMMLSATVFQMLLLMVRNASGAAMKTGSWPFIGVLVVHGALRLTGLTYSRPARGPQLPASPTP
jgi:oligosaccharide repeat unit polymerase